MLENYNGQSDSGDCFLLLFHIRERVSLDLVESVLRYPISFPSLLSKVFRLDALV